MASLTAAVTRRRTVATATSALLALVMVALGVGRVSSAGFSDQTGTDALLAAGTVRVTDDDAGSVMFNTADDGLLDGGRTLTRCIAVTYEGSLVQDTRIRMSGTATGALADYLNLTVEEGTGGSAATCDGFTPSEDLYDGTVAGFASTHPSVYKGVSSWKPAATGEVRTYRVTVQVANTPAAQQQSATGTFTWTATTGPDPFTPADLTDKVLWLSPDDLSGATVTTWADRSERANILTATGTAIPVVDGATPAGGKALDFKAGSALVADGDLGLTSQAVDGYAKNIYETGAEGYRAFDGNPSTAWYCKDGAPTWLTARFKDGPQVVTSYGITPRAGWLSHTPQAWTFEGSDDNEHWTVLDTRSGVGWPDYNEQTFSFSNDTAYRWYRLNISVGGVAPGTCDIAELTFNGVANSRTPYPGEMWVVVKATATGNPLTRFSGWQSSHFPWGNGTIYENFGLAGERPDFGEGTTPLLNQWRVYRVTSDGAQWQASLDNQVRRTLSGQAIAWLDRVSVGGAAGVPFQGQVAEVLIRRTVSTPQEAAQITGYLNAKHGLSVPTP